MKKLISILLVTVMLAAMIPAAALTATATEAEPAQSGNWTDAGNYDISWAEDLIVDEIPTKTEGDQQVPRTDECAILNDTIYLCKYINATYEIDTVEKLAGLAVLANASNIETFSGATFKLTAAEYDLSEHLWMPIANRWNTKFRGSLISDNGTVIKGMTIISEDTSHERCWGLIGMHGNGSIKNITLENAVIDVACGNAASFVGYENHCGTGVYENLKSDAVIKNEMPVDTTTGLYQKHANGWVCAGGILGVHNNTNGGQNLEIKNCIFTGNIDAPSVVAVGGIVAIDRTNNTETLTIEKCVVSSEFFRYGKYRHGLSDQWYGGMGGIIGLRIGGPLVLKECYVSIGEFTVYQEENLAKDTNENLIIHQSIAGMVGNNDYQVTLTNCQVDMLSSSGLYSSHHAVFLGRHMGAATFTSCVNSGAFARIMGAGWNGANTFAWSARNPGITDGGNNFASFEQRYGWDVTASMPTVIESVETWKASLDSNVWSEREGSIYPILTIAKNYDDYSVSGAGVDYSFFNISGCNVNTVEELRGIANISDMMRTYGGSGHLMATTGANANRVTIAQALATADFTGFSDSALALIGAKLGKELVAPDGVNDRSKISVQFAQIAVAANVNIEKPDKNGTYNVRVVAKFADPTVANVYFDYALVQNGAVTKQAESAKITDCYRDVIKEVNGEQTVITAQDGYYVILDIYDVNFKDVTSSVVSVRAYATGADGTVYYSGNYVDITLTSPAAN